MYMLIISYYRNRIFLHLLGRGMDYENTINSEHVKLQPVKGFVQIRLSVILTTSLSHYPYYMLR